MKEEEEETKKKRQRLTLTAIIQALNDMCIATFKTEEQDELVECSVVMQRKMMKSASGGGMRPGYCVMLFRNFEDNLAEPDCLYDVISPESFEDALNLLLKEVEQALVLHKKMLSHEVDSIMDLHRGALKGARSKLKKS